MELKPKKTRIICWKNAESYVDIYIYIYIYIYIHTYTHPQKGTFFQHFHEKRCQKLGTDSKKCQCRWKRPANVENTCRCRCSSKCWPYVVDICIHPYRQVVERCLSAPEGGQSAGRCICPPRRGASCPMGAAAGHSALQILQLWQWPVQEGCSMGAQGGKHQGIWCPPHIDPMRVVPRLIWFIYSFRLVLTSTVVWVSADEFLSIIWNSVKLKHLFARDFSNIVEFEFVTTSLHHEK